MIKIHIHYQQVRHVFQAAPKLNKKYASINTSNPVSKRIHAGKFWICVSHIFEGCFASLEFLLESCALGSADLYEVVFRILALLEHSFDSSLQIAHFQYQYKVRYYYSTIKPTQIRKIYYEITEGIDVFHLSFFIRFHVISLDTAWNMFFSSLLIKLSTTTRTQLPIILLLRLLLFLNFSALLAPLTLYGLQCISNLVTVLLPFRYFIFLLVLCRIIFFEFLSLFIDNFYFKHFSFHLSFLANLNMFIQSFAIEFSSAALRALNQFNLLNLFTLEVVAVSKWFLSVFDISFMQFWFLSLIKGSLLFNCLVVQFFLLSLLKGIIRSSLKLFISLLILNLFATIVFSEIQISSLFILILFITHIRDGWLICYLSSHLRDILLFSDLLSFLNSA